MKTFTTVLFATGLLLMACDPAEAPKLEEKDEPAKVEEKKPELGKPDAGSAPADAGTKADAK